jgi:hypothetical protein
MDFIQHQPHTLNASQLDDAIAWLVARNRHADAAPFRREKLNRAYVVALNNRIAADPTLANTTSVVVS